MELALALFGTTILGVGLISLLGVCVREALRHRWSMPDRDTQMVVLSQGELVDADHEPGFIAMPDHLKSHAEMVVWMTRDLPRLTAGIRNTET